MSRMSFVGDFSDANYYQGTATGLNDQTYSVGAVVAVGAGGTHNQAIFSCFDIDGPTGYELRAPGPSWSAPSGQYFQGQAGATVVTQQKAPVTPVSALRKVMFVCLTATASAQILYVNGIQISQNAGPAPAIAVGNLRIGGNPNDNGSSCDVVLINCVFYTNAVLTAAEIQNLYTQFGAYGRLAPDGTTGAVTVDHFWDLIDNKSGSEATWTSRGATGGKVLTEAGTCAIGSTGTAQWGL